MRERAAELIFWGVIVVSAVIVVLAVYGAVILIGKLWP